MCSAPEDAEEAEDAETDLNAEIAEIAKPLAGRCRAARLKNASGCYTSG